MSETPNAILCMDIDGTLIDAEERIHPRDIQMLQHLPRNVQPLFTTGRILHSAKGVLQKNRLFQSSRLPWPGIFMNGGAAYLPDEKYCLSHTFNPETKRHLIQLAAEFPKTAFTFFTIDSVYLVNPTPFAEDIAKRHYLAAQAASGSTIPDDVVKVMVLEPQTERISQIEAQARVLHAEMAYSLPYAYEINPPNITKARSLKTLLAAMDMDLLPVYAVGDAENDLPMFEIAVASFAPDTADPKVTSIATMVIPRDERGIIEPVLDFLSVTGTI